MKIDWTPLREILQTRQRFVLTTHVRPDADAIGSEMAMAGLLDQLGMQVRIINASPVPTRLKFLDPEGRCLQVGAQISEDHAREADVHLILDTSAWGQLAEMGRVVRNTPAVKVVVDHHVSSEDLGAIDLKDTDAEATGALVFQFAQAMGIRITPPIAAA